MGDVNLDLIIDTINGTKNSIDETTKAINYNANELHLSNLINLVNLGLMSKEDVINDSVYQLYKMSLFNGEEISKKSLVK